MPFDGLPVIDFPIGVADCGVFDRLSPPTFDLHRHGQPDGTSRGLDLVSIDPETLDILHVIVQDDFVSQIEAVEVPLPRQIEGLNDDQAFFRCCMHDGSGN